MQQQEHQDIFLQPNSEWHQNSNSVSKNVVDGCSCVNVCENTPSRNGMSSNVSLCACAIRLCLYLKQGQKARSNFVVFFSS